MTKTFKLAVALLLGLTLPTQVPGFPEEFRLQASEVETSATAVALVGTFNEWHTESHRMVRVADEFRVGVDATAGEHRYHFLIQYPDGTSRKLLDRRWPYYVADAEKNVFNLIVLTGSGRKAPENMEAFRLGATESDDAYVAGEFNNWRPKEISMFVPDAFVAECWIRYPRPFAYKYFVMEQWGCEGSAEGIESRPDGFGGMNNFRPLAESNFAPLVPRLNEDLGTVVRPHERPVPIKLIREVAFTKRNYQESIRMLLESRRILLNSGLNPEERATAKQELYRYLMLEAEVHTLFGFPNETGRVLRELAARQGSPTPETRKAWYDLAKHLQYVQYDENGARQIYKKLLAAATDNREQASILADVARLSLSKRNWEGVITTMELAFEVGPGPEGQDADWKHFLGKSHTLLGMAYLASNEKVKAKLHFEETVALVPDPSDPLTIQAIHFLESMTRNPDGDWRELYSFNFTGGEGS